MKLREEEFYNQYHQHGGTTIIPTEIFNELYDDATEEIERLNNIINELEQWLEKAIENISHVSLDGASGLDMALKKIKELKGVDKE